jgi:hypothetical protein
MAATPAGTFPVESHLVGEHNVYNMLAAIGVALHEGATIDQVRQAVTRVTNVPGRFERVIAGQPFTVVVDYAHTEDALVRLLTAAQALKAGRIITVWVWGIAIVGRPRWDVLPSRATWSFSPDNPRTENPCRASMKWKSVCGSAATAVACDLSGWLIGVKRSRQPCAQPGPATWCSLPGKDTKTIRLSGPRSFTLMIVKSPVMRSVS